MEGRSCRAANYGLTTIPDRRIGHAFDSLNFRAPLEFSLCMPSMDNERQCPDCNNIMDIAEHLREVILHLVWNNVIFVMIPVRGQAIFLLPLEGLLIWMFR